MDNKEKSAIEKREEPRPTEYTRSAPHYSPDVDIYETDAELVLLADMPGVDRESVDVDLSGGVLAITGTLQPRKLEAGFQCIACEFQRGHFGRSFTLTEEVDSGKIAASMSRGVLRLVLPKVGAARTRKIAIKAGS